MNPAMDGLFFMNSWVSTPVRPGLKNYVRMFIFILF